MEDRSIKVVIEIAFGVQMEATKRVQRGLYVQSDVALDSFDLLADMCIYSWFVHLWVAYKPGANNPRFLTTKSIYTRVLRSRDPLFIRNEFIFLNHSVSSITAFPHY